MEPETIVYFSVMFLLLVLGVLFVREEDIRDEAAVFVTAIAILIWPLALPIFVLIMFLLFLRRKTEKLRKRLYNKGVEFE